MKHMQGGDHDAGAQHQRNLFWFNDPQLVISLIQVMQFGYAIALAIVIMFWSDLGEVAPYYYFVATLVCYGIFVSVLAKVLPQFTLCTSLGHLVNKDRLNETVALHRFHEEQRRRKRKLVQLTFGENLDESILCVQEMPGESTDNLLMKIDPATGETKAVTLLNHQDSAGALSSTVQSISSGSSSGFHQGLYNKDGMPRSASAENMISKTSVPSVSSGDSYISPNTPKEKSSLLAELVKMDTSQLRQQLRDERNNARRTNRKKAVSDGVQAMRGMGGPPPDMSKMKLVVPAPNASKDKSAGEATTTVFSGTVDDAEIQRQDRATRKANRKATRKKSVSASSIIQSWRSIEEDGVETKAPQKAPLSQIAEDGHHQRTKSSSNPDMINSWQQKQQQATTGDGVNFVLKHPNHQKTTDDPAILHRQLRAERMAQERQDRRRNRAASASAVIQSWQDHSINDPPATMPSEVSEEEDSFFLGSNAPADDDNNEKSEDLNGTIDGAPAVGDKLEEREEGVTVVNLADASLLPEANENAPRAKKSVGFSSMDDDDDDDHSDSSFIGNTKHSTDGADDDSTVDTGKSVGELSDVGGVAQSGFDSYRSSYYWEPPWYVKLQQRLSPTAIKKFYHGYFVGGSHALFSHVFGSIIVFFLIGMRLETFNAVTGIYAPSVNTWELRLNVAFWWQATWYMLFLIVSGLAVWAVHPSECKSIPERRAFAAAVFDIFLSILCLTLLFVADAQRCCDGESYGLEEGLGRRFLRLLKGEEEEPKDSYGEESLYAAADPYASESGIYDDDIYTQCCPFWGSRTYGGYGNIEPCTALIGLRVLRFYFAKHFVRLMAKDAGKEAASSASTNQEHSAEDHHDDGHGDKSAEDHHDDGHGDSHGHVGADKGTALELWQLAIAKHPQIAEKYGQFSGELFQAMLGLDIIEEDCNTKSVASIKHSMSPSTSAGDLPALNDESNHPHYKLTGDQYSSLSEEAQGFILAGKLGKPVKSMANLLEHSTSVGDLPTLHEESATEGEHAAAKPPTSTNLEFEVDDDLLAEEEDAESDFIAPNARLVRSMRRCERRLYPLLKEWTPVDVVITDYEIVYFDVESDSDDNLSPELRKKKEALRVALHATKGGKGLRLMDVAAGRKVVGHLALTDVTQVHVERHMPLIDVSYLERDEQNIDVGNQPASEYWQKTSHIEVHDHSRMLRWAKVKQDCLKLVSIHGTLLLRYYSDLNDVESHLEASAAEDELFGAMKKNISFQWAQTIAHTCGIDQLKQPLPHFGTNDTEELRDYLEVVHHKPAEARHHRRVSSNFMGNHNSSYHSSLNSHHDLSTSAGAGAQRPKPTLRPSKSFGDNAPVLEKAKSMRFFRLSSSAGDYDSKPRAQSDDGLDDIEIGNEDGGISRDSQKWLSN
jgi:hypothetical protein